jgi:Ca2+-transporting ATPase
LVEAEEMNQDLELGNGFPISTNDIDDLMTDYDEERLNSIGGLKGLALSLRSDLENGLSTTEAKAGFVDRKQKFGSNIYPQFPTPHYLVFLGQTFKDPTMIILSVAAVVSLVLGSVPISDSDATNEGPQWIQGLAISIVVIIQTNVMAINNWSKDKKFRKLNEQRNDSKTKVIRSNVEHLVDIEDVNVGDLVVLEQGDFVPADGFYIYGHNLLVDEANMTGESDAVLKTSVNPILYSGSHVVEGSGRMLALRIGPSSTWGKTLAQLKAGNSMTPLQRRLKKLVILLGKIGAVCAALVFAALTIYWLVNEVVDQPWEWGKLRRVIEFFIVAITLVVVAVPEGMPLCVTVCLAYTMGKMLSDKCLVRRLSACEAMGGVTTICSDKTGTLTENRMTVVEGWISKTYYQKISEIIQLDDAIKTIVSQSIAVNSKAFIDQTDDKIEFVGNKTECAMLVFLEQCLEIDYRVVRKETQVDRIQDFTSDTKYMCTWITTANQPRVLFKGAPEVILARSRYYVDNDGQIHELNDELNGELHTLIYNMAGKGK